MLKGLQIALYCLEMFLEKGYLTGLFKNDSFFRALDGWLSDYQGVLGFFHILFFVDYMGQMLSVQHSLIKRQLPGLIQIADTPF